MHKTENFFMKTKYIIGLILLLSVLSEDKVYGETVSQKEASRIAQLFFNAANRQVMASPNLVYNGRRLTTDRLFSPFYIYNHPTGGFVIISADNKAMPILGYSIKENFNPEGMNKSVEALLRRYAYDIEMIRHDSRVPEEAIKAWSDLNSYISDLLKAGYDATDPQMTIEEAGEYVENFETTQRLDELSSDLYYPSQWQEFVDVELGRQGSFPIGLIDNGDILPVIIHGKKGDYYRLFTGEYNDWLMRLMATEYLSYGQLADFSLPINEIEEEEDPAFEFYDSFIEEMELEQARIQNENDMQLISQKPVVRTIGGGRYEITLPEKAFMSRIYNLSGALVRQNYYTGNYNASISLEGLPYGFYIVVVNDITGQPYEFKFSR